MVTLRIQDSVMEFVPQRFGRVLQNIGLCSRSPAIDEQAPSTASQVRTYWDSWRMQNLSHVSSRQRGSVQGNDYTPLPCAGNNGPASSRSRDTELGVQQQLSLSQPSSQPVAHPASSIANEISLSEENGGSCASRKTAENASSSTRSSTNSLRPNSQLSSGPRISSRLPTSRSCSSLDDRLLELPLKSAVPTATTTPMQGNSGSVETLRTGDGDGTGAEAGPRQQNGGSLSTPCSPTTPRSRQSDTYQYLSKRLPEVSNDVDLERLIRSMYGLEEGRFYFGGLDSIGARDLLQYSPEGTFLVRDSSDPKFLFAITVKTSRGATSVRIRYHHGFFQLDCEDEMRRKLPRFETMLDLLDFHVSVCRERQGAQYRWLESSRRKDMVVRLTTPLRHSPPSLGHLARVTINRCLEDLHLPSRSTDLLPLPPGMKTYLRQYAYKI